MNTPDCLLSCGCWQRVRIDKAIPNDPVTCNRHGETYTSIELTCYVYIVRVNDYEWHVRCQEYGCRYGRWFGQSEGTAKRANGKHATVHNHLGGVTYDRITWDGKGAVYREGADRNARTNPKPPPKVNNIRLPISPPDYPPPPF